MKRIYLILTLLVLTTTLHAQKLDWAANIGGKYTDRALSVIIDKQGNKYIGGHYNDTVDFDFGPGTAIRSSTPDGIGRGVAYVLKLDAADNFVKVLSFGSLTSQGYTAVSAMSKDTSGNLFLAGYFSTTTDFDPDTSVTYNVSPVGGNEIFLVKLDANENFLWVKHWVYNFPEGSGNGGNEEGPGMAIDAAGNVCLTSRYKGTTDFDPGAGTYNLTSLGAHGFVLKLDNDGNFIWVKGIAADTAGANVVYPRSISTDGSGNMYIAGDFLGIVDFNPDTVSTYKLTDSVQNGFILKLGSDGSFQWAKQIGGIDNPLSSYNFANAVVVDGASNILLCGSYMGSVTMGSTTLTSNGYSDMYMAKLDGSGNYLWAKTIGNSWDSDMASRLSVDETNSVYITGTYRGTLDFDPGAGVKNITSNGNVDVFLLKLNTHGDFSWAKSFGGSDHRERIYSIAANSSSVYIVGRFMVQMNCDDEGSYYINAGYAGSGTSRYDGWVAKIDPSATGIDDIDRSLDVAIFPNPATSAFSLDLSSLQGNVATISVYDLQGKKLFEAHSAEHAATINIEKFTTGTYFVKIQIKDNYLYKKLMIVH